MMFSRRYPYEQVTQVEGASVMRLFHVSEQQGIDRFRPRARKVGDPVVWAISDIRLHNYLLPRDCPRVTFCAGAQTTLQDRERFLTDFDYVVAIEYSWLMQCYRTTLFVYEFDPSLFKEEDETAGYYTCRETVAPIAAYEINDVFQALYDRKVEIRILPTLWYLRERVIQSSLDFSIIRMRHAGPVPAGFESAFPVSH